MKDRDNQIKSHTEHKIVPIVLPTECYNNTIYDDDCVSHWNNYYYYAKSGGLPWQILFEKECLWLGLDTIVKVLFLDWRSTIRKGISTKGIHGCFTNFKLNSCFSRNQHLLALSHRLLCFFKTEKEFHESWSKCLISRVVVSSSNYIGHPALILLFHFLQLCIN